MAEGTRELEALLEGLATPQKTVSSKYFYDRRGSELFEQITQLSEYYPTRTERALLREHTRGWINRFAPMALVELGAGSAEKTRILLEALIESRLGGSPALYIPIDVSAEYLAGSARALAVDYPALTVSPMEGDITKADFCDSLDPPRPALFALLGSTIGNFIREAAVAMIRSLAGCMREGDAFLMGADLRPGPGKSREELEAAYNDVRGVTAEFNKNLLRVLNDRFGADFDVSAFGHRSYYDPVRHRIEMHLVAASPLEVHLGGRTFDFRKGETLRTEISCKYDRETVSGMFTEAGLRLTEWVTDELGRYGMALGIRDLAGS